jgi:uncharacterized protein YfaS (alpha-2-macroglobulin family)
MTGANKIFQLALALAAAASGLGQSEKQPYFSLTTTRTFASNEKPRITFSAWNVDSLEFRVYRIEDPVKFFEQIEDPHEFGGRAPRPPHERTLLERIHLWKGSLHAGILRSLRAQFTEPPSAHFWHLSRPQPKPLSPGTHYAEAPLLNPQQLVFAFTQPVRAHSRWQQQEVEIGVNGKGAYLVEAVRGDLRAYTVLMVSDIALITKVASGRLVNTVVDRTTGEPLPGVKLWMLGRDRQLAETQTDRDGSAEIRMAAARGTAARLVARRGADFAVNALEEYVATDDWRAYIYTDRPVYRPGHTVHFNAILRSRGAGAYEVPAGKTVFVRIEDPDQKPVYQKTLTAGTAGTVHDDLNLGPAAALGTYSIEARSGESQMDATFGVEEYKKPEYEVRVAAAKARVLQGETVQATVDAEYYFGEPVSGAKVQWAVYRSRYWFPRWRDPDDEDDSESAAEADDAADAGDQLGQGEGELDGDGKLNIPVQTVLSDRKFDYVYRIEARVTDQSRREIVGRGYFIATYGSFALNVRPDLYFYTPSSRGEFSIEARDYDDKPVRTHVRLELFPWRQRQRDYGDAVAAAEADTGDDGTAKVALSMPSDGGSYRVRVTARTSEGRDVEDFTYVYISGAARDDYSAGARNIQILADKKSYRAGDTAKLLIVAGQDNTPLFVSVEGLDLRQRKLLRSKGATAEFEIPITAADEPGFTVQAEFVRAGGMYVGSKYVSVPPVEHKLNVKVATDKTQYLPGQTAEYDVEVTGADGKPAPHAEFSLGVVDEAIYAIRPDTTEDIVRFFYGREWDRVIEVDSFSYYFNGEAGKRRMQLAELRPTSRLAQLKPERFVQPKIRKAFPDTAFWSASVTTDAAGHARAKVEFPDSLTTWRATARGVTLDTKVGSATLKTIVRKNLILRLAVPRFLVQGDEVVISALVHNYLPDAKTARVSLDLTGLDVIEGSAKDVQVPSRGEARVDWRVRAQQVRGAKIVGKALTDEESDALELELPVNVPGLKMAQSRGGSFAGGGEAAFDLAFPAAVVPGSRSLAIRVSPSIAGSLFGALEYLTSFPYGCVEQTMSSFLPDIVVSQAVRDLGVKTDLDEASLREKIGDGLERLYAFQHPDGGWGWWETDESHPFMTAYVVAGLAQAQAAGVNVKPEVVQKGAAWTRTYFARDSRLASDLRAYMAYALAVSGSPGGPELNAVFDARANLSPYGLALLGLALEQAKDVRASEIASLIERAVQQDEQQAWWSATRDQMLDFEADVTPEATAFAVKFLSHQHGDSPLVPKAALWLMNHRDEGYWWSSTKQTAMVIYGLSDYLKAAGELNPSLDVAVFVNGRQAMTRHLEQATTLEEPALVIDESGLKPGVNNVRIAASGKGRIYYSARAEYSSTDEKLQKTGTVSLNLLRDYFRLTPSRDGQRIVYDLAPLTGGVAPGDVLAVRLTVTGTEWKYLMLEDPIPAGAEFIERDASYQLRARPPWWEWYFTRRELHDDRMAIFETWFPQGQKQYFYLLKVVNPGIFKIDPARVQPMYQPGSMATTESRALEVK